MIFPSVDIRILGCSIGSEPDCILLYTAAIGTLADRIRTAQGWTELNDPKIVVGTDA